MMFLLAMLQAFAADGVEVTVRVVDPEGEPIGTAVVRHPEEQERHRVNVETGEWTESVLYLEGGRELVFEKGTELLLEVSAAGYKTQSVVYRVRRRKNVIEVPLAPLRIDRSEDDPEDVQILMPRPRPLDK